MNIFNAQNERIKRQYYTYLEQSDGKLPVTVDQVAAAIADFEKSIGFKEFKAFNVQHAIDYKANLLLQKSLSTGNPLSISTVHARLMALKKFVQWLWGQPGYKSRIRLQDWNYFNLTNNDTRKAHAVRERDVPTMEQIRQALGSMPTSSEFQMRDKAIFAAAILTGARDGALATFSIKHVDLEKRLVHQDGREVRTKNAKTFTSSFFPVGDDIENVVMDWIRFLVTEKGFGPSDPLFPPTQIKRGASGGFEAVGFKREHWKDAGHIRKVFKQAFEGAGLPYFNPHSIRKTLVLYGATLRLDQDEVKAWSQNMGHDHVATTFNSYGKISHERQTQIFDRLRMTTVKSELATRERSDEEIALAYLTKIVEKGNFH